MENAEALFCLIVMLGVVCTFIVALSLAQLLLAVIVGGIEDAHRFIKNRLARMRQAKTDRWLHGGA